MELNQEFEGTRLAGFIMIMSLSKDPYRRLFLTGSLYPSRRYSGRKVNRIIVEGLFPRDRPIYRK
ncbi:hypothetical protein ACWFPQ_08725 [Peribacillus butanolivorans]